MCIRAEQTDKKRTFAEPWADCPFEYDRQQDNANNGYAADDDGAKPSVVSGRPSGILNYRIEWDDPI